MSHFTTIRTELRDMDVLLETLHDLGLAFKKGASLEGLGRRRKRVDIAVYGEGGFRWGFRKGPSSGTYAVTGLKEVLSNPADRHLLKRVMQDYAKRKVLKETTKRGYALVRQQMNTGGTIVLVLRKMSTRAA